MLTVSSRVKEAASNRESAMTIESIRHARVALSCALLACAMVGCSGYAEIPPYTPVEDDEQPDMNEEEPPPCDPLPGLTRPVYLCENETRHALFVDPATGADTQPGTRDAPLSTLDRALELAGQDSSISAILIAGSPQIPGPIRLTQDVSLLGGFASPTFAQDGNARPTITATPMMENDTLVGIIASGLDEAVVLRDLDVITPDNPKGATVGVILDQAELILERTLIRAGTGASGEAGSQGGPGEAGAMGQAGGQQGQTSAGEGGANTSCPDASGGAGGQGGKAGSSAEPGAASALEAPGGQPGMPGTHGTDGAEGDPGDPAGPGTWNQAGYMPGAAASVGDAGSPGQGGGGGGGGASNAGQGGGGGGGGAGGCPGDPGQPGTSGSPSVAIFAIDAKVTLRNAQISTTGGGAGGAGGAGSEGGSGASGGAGVSGANGGSAGGRGGDGGQGGTGGVGGYGLGGESWGVLCVRSTLDTASSLIQPGPGGKHGNGETAMSGNSSGCEN